MIHVSIRMLAPTIIKRNAIRYASICGSTKITIPNPIKKRPIGSIGIYDLRRVKDYPRVYTILLTLQYYFLQAQHSQNSGITYVMPESFLKVPIYWAATRSLDSWMYHTPWGRHPRQSWGKGLDTWDSLHLPQWPHRSYSSSSLRIVQCSPYADLGSRLFLVSWIVRE